MRWARQPLRIEAQADRGLSFLAVWSSYCILLWQPLRAYAVIAETLFLATPIPRRRDTVDLPLISGRRYD